MSVKPFFSYALAAVSCILVIIAAYAMWNTGRIQEFINIDTANNSDKLISDNFDDNEFSINVLVKKADAALSAGELTSALELYQQVLTLYSKLSPEEIGGISNEIYDFENQGGDILIMRKLFEIAVLIGDQERAESILGLLSFRGVSEQVIDALRGFMLIRNGEIDSAKSFFEKNSTFTENAYGLLLVDILNREHESVQNSLELLLASKDPFVLHAVKSVKGAYDEFDLFEEGKDVHLETLIARSLASVGQCPVSEMLLSDVVSKESDYRDAWIILGYCRLILQDDDGALFAFSNAYDLDPEKSEIQYFLGLTYEKLEDIDEAERFLGYALKNGFPKQKHLMEKLAVMSENKGDFASAAIYYQSIIENEEEVEVNVYVNLISLLVEHLDGLLEAKEILDDIRDEFGDIPEVLDMVGWVALEEGDVDNAAIFLNASVNQNPNLSSAWYHKAMLEERIGEFSKAISSYKKSYNLSIGVDNILAKKSADRHNSLIQR